MLFSSAAAIDYTVLLLTVQDNIAQTFFKKLYFSLFPKLCISKIILKRDIIYIPPPKAGENKNVIV
ncbi:MAG: hypothetical protein LBR79_01565 [Oscillospiraceae bacterium]|nr:hypothetical protein [Oscillospiraceae bacterium]